MTVGWYVHHHGAGHLSRLRAVAGRLPGITALGSAPPPDAPCAWITLADDRTEEPVDATAQGTLHWVPHQHPGLRDRMAAVAAWIARARPDVLVVDVSVEVALLGRLLGVPTVLIAQRGRRLDAPHRLAYRPGERRRRAVDAADAPGGRPPADRAPAVLRRGLPAGRAAVRGPGAGRRRPAARGLRRSRPGRRRRRARRRRHAGPDLARGGSAARRGPRRRRPRAARRRARAARALRGPSSARRAATSWPRSPPPGGPSSASRSRGPFAEQDRTGEALRRLGTAEVLVRWPDDAAWPSVLAAAEARDRSRWEVLHDGQGARRLAAVVQDAAESPLTRSGTDDARLQAAGSAGR